MHVIKGDITKQEVDAIVNAANTSLLGGGGVDGAIHRAGGIEILAECRKIRNRQGGCKTGEAVITTAGKLPAKHVIHTVGPRWNNNPESDQLLKNCYLNSLKIAVENNISSMAFPNISTGIFRYPKERAAKIAIQTVRMFLAESSHHIEVNFICFDEENFKIYSEILSKE